MRALSLVSWLWRWSQIDQSGLPSTMPWPWPSGWGASISLVSSRTFQYHGTLRSMSVTVMPMWWIAAMSGMRWFSSEIGGSAGGGDGETVRGGDPDEHPEIRVDRCDLAIDLREELGRAGPRGHGDHRAAA